MAYSSSLSDQEWKLIEPLLPQKKQTLSTTVEQTSDSRVAFSTSSKTAAIGVTYPKTYRLTQRCSGTTNNGEKLEP